MFDFLASVRAIVCTGMLAAVPLLILPCDARAQENGGLDVEESSVTGTVVSSSRNSFVVRLPGGRYQVFVFDRDTSKPRTLSVGSEVRVVSTPGGEAGMRQASSVTVVTEAPAAGAAGSTAPGTVVPASVRRLERDIERQVRRFQVGVRAGAALDPEVIIAGVHAQVGSGFSSRVFFRPNVEFGWGELTTMFALNLEAIYRLPVSARQGRWSAYFGAGPGFNFLHQNFERKERNIDFGDFDYSTCLNVLGGVQNRNGMFLELKSSVYAGPAPTMRLMVGYNF